MVKSWGDLTERKWFLVVRMKDVTTGYGPTKVLTLRRNEQKENFEVWSTKMINDSINEKWDEKGSGSLFVKSLGKKKSKSGSKKSYFMCKYKIIP